MFGAPHAKWEGEGAEISVSVLLTVPHLRESSQTQ